MLSNVLPDFRWPTAGPPLVMGVVNVTPDSFSGDGIHGNTSRAVEHAEHLVHDGADLLDIGAESTRPGYRSVETQEELARLLPVLRAVIRRVHVPISVDTSKSEVARRAMAEGAAIINDVSGLRDPHMPSVMASTQAGVVLVHNGLPPPSAIPIHAVVTQLRRLQSLCADYGVAVERVAVDPGLGIGGKDWRTNFPIMRDLPALTVLHRPILVGASRKGMIARTLGPGIEARLHGSLALAALCLAGGASILRVHDVRETKQVVRVIDAIRHAVDIPGA